MVQFTKRGENIVVNCSEIWKKGWWWKKTYWLISKTYFQEKLVILKFGTLTDLKSQTYAKEKIKFFQCQKKKQEEYVKISELAYCSKI